MATYTCTVRVTIEKEITVYARNKDDARITAQNEAPGYMTPEDFDFADFEVLTVTRE